MTDQEFRKLIRETDYAPMRVLYFFEHGVSHPDFDRWLFARYTMMCGEENYFDGNAAEASLILQKTQAREQREAMTKQVKDNKELTEAICERFCLIDAAFYADNDEGTDPHFLIGTRTPNILTGICLLFQWRTLRKFIASQLPEGTTFKIVLL